MLDEGFVDFDLEVNGVRIAGAMSADADAADATDATDGAGTASATTASAREKPTLLLLHGHPENHLMWHRVAPQLIEEFTLVMPDLRGYGRSGRPESGADHSAYSNRAMAADAVALMERLGHSSFVVCGHDRGARVAARMAADHPDRVRRLLLLDVAPTLRMYEDTTRAFAEAYWHWFFLIQPAPMPETLIGADPKAYVEGVMGARHAGLTPFPREVLDSYAEGLRGADRARGICEDYRASAGIDLDHDRADIAVGRLIEPELRVLWARHGVIERLFEPLSLWGEVARSVSGHVVDCGHYLPEEAPAEVVAEIRSFLGSAA